MDNSTYKHIGIIGSTDFGLQDKLELYRIIAKENLTHPIIVANQMGLSKDEFSEKIKTVYETHYKGNDIQIELINQDDLNSSAVDIEKAVNDMKEDYNAKRIVDDMMYSTVTQNNCQPFYATLKPSKHKKTNKKKRK